MKKISLLTLFTFSMCISLFSQEAMIITPEGNVGINTSTPSEKLDVNGNLIVTGHLTVERIVDTPRFERIILKPTTIDLVVTSFLPTAPVLGDRVVISNTGAGYFKITAVPVIGSLLPGECCELLWESINSEWLLISRPPSNVLPVGFMYIQFPNKKSPTELGLVGEWENKSSEYAGDFFRVDDGDNIGAANNFNSGEQLDAIQEHGHELGADNFLGNGGNTMDHRVAYGFEGDSVKTKAVRNIVDGRMDPNETRPVNQTIRIWERTK